MNRLQVSKLWPRGHIWPTTYFHKSFNKNILLNHSQARSFIDNLLLLLPSDIRVEKVWNRPSDHKAWDIYYLPHRIETRVWSSFPYSYFQFSSSLLPNLSGHLGRTTVRKNCSCRAVSRSDKCPCTVDAGRLLCDGVIPSSWVLIFQVHVPMPTVLHFFLWLVMIQSQLTLKQQHETICVLSYS